MVICLMQFMLMLFVITHIDKWRMYYLVVIFDFDFREKSNWWSVSGSLLRSPLHHFAIKCLHSHSQRWKEIQICVEVVETTFDFTLTASYILSFQRNFQSKNRPMEHQSWCSAACHTFLVLSLILIFTLATSHTPTIMIKCDLSRL